MELTEDKKSEILKKVAPIIGSFAAMGVVAIAGTIISKLTATNLQSSSLIGDKGIHPTNDDASISKVETSAKDTDASLAKDEVTAKDGDLSAVKTDAAASNGEATALDGGATAARTKSGAADIETKALKMT